MTRLVALLSLVLIGCVQDGSRVDAAVRPDAARDAPTRWMRCEGCEIICLPRAICRRSDGTECEGCQPFCGHPQYSGADAGTTIQCVARIPGHPTYFEATCDGRTVANPQHCYRDTFAP